MIPLFRISDRKTECLLCPHYCKLSEGKTGICGVRKNIEGKIELLTYGAVSGYSLDPVEKKPLYHFFPGQNILSVGSFGCNMRCDFCQNHNISQTVPTDIIMDITPEKIIRDSLSAKNNIGVAFTYNEPVIWFEFMRDVAISAKENDLHTALVSNGYVNREPLEEIIRFTDAFNIDLKAFSNRFYKKLTGADIEPVKNSLKQIAKSGKHLEITSLIIPGMNDNDEEMHSMSEWIAEELGENVPLHLSRYYPMYKRDDPSTPAETLTRLHSIASEKLKYVYLGNINANVGQNSICPVCGTVVTKRTGYRIALTNLNTKGECTECGTKIYKYFTMPSQIKN